MILSIWFRVSNHGWIRISLFGRPRLLPDHNGEWYWLTQFGDNGGYILEWGQCHPR
jgi:hypothetical protein